ncbi:MAG: hypothetical protein ACR2JE_16205 [Acidobacteriaceae bacterium]
MRGDALRDHLIGVYTCYGRRKCDLAVLTAYLDESGIHQGDHLCVVAGWVGSEAEWLPFIQPWMTALGRRHNLHMKELRWNQHPERVGNLLARLGPIPENCGLRPVYGGIWQRDYEAIVKGRVKETFTSPYMLAAQRCIAAALHSMGATSERIGFVFDNQELYKDRIARLEKVVFQTAKVDTRVNGISFMKRESTVCLDPADYLAFQLREYNTDKASTKSRLGMSIFGKNAGHGFGIGHIDSPDELQRMVGLLRHFGYYAEAEQ